MGGEPPVLEFVTLHSFERQAAGLLAKSARAKLKARLAANPQAGDLIPGTGGMRNLRVGATGKGTRSGARVIYYFQRATRRIYLISAYARNVNDDLTPDEKRELRGLTAILDDEG